MLSFTCLVHLRYSRIANTSHIIFFWCCCCCCCCYCLKHYSLDNKIMNCAAHWNHSKKYKWKHEPTHTHTNAIKRLYLHAKLCGGLNAEKNLIVLLLCWNRSKWMAWTFPLNFILLLLNIDIISIGFVCKPAAINVWIGK